MDGPCYLRLLQDVIPGLLDGLGLDLEIRNNIIYMHDGAPAHWDRNVRNHLDQTYPNRWIGRGGPMAWPARSPDLNPLDYFMWGYIKQVVYRGDVHDQQRTKTLIVDAFKSLKDSAGLVKAVNNHTRRVKLCLQENGGHVEHLR